MKRIVCALMVLGLSMATMGQVSYKVTYKGLENGKKVYLNNGETRAVMDSAVVEAGIVKFSGQVPESVVAVLHERPGQVRNALYELVLDDYPVIVQEGQIVEGSVANLRYGKYQDEQNRLTTKVQDIIGEFRKLQEQHNGQIPEADMQSLRERMEQVSEESERLTRGMLDENRDNLLPLTTLLYSADNLGYDFVGEYLKTYDLAVRASLAPLKVMLRREEVKKPGAKVVNFTMKNLKGETVNLTDWVGRGQYVLVDFWASWCGPCRADMPHVKSLYEKYHPKGFEIVGVSLDRTQEAWEKGVESLGIPWPQMSDLKYWQSEGAALYNIRAIPATVLFCPDGTVVESGLRGESLTKKLEEIYE